MDSIMDNGVHIVRMNSHLQVSTSLFTQTGYTHFLEGLHETKLGNIHDIYDDVNNNQRLFRNKGKDQYEWGKKYR